MGVSMGLPIGDICRRLSVGVTWRGLSDKELSVGAFSGTAYRGFDVETN